MATVLVTGASGFVGSFVVPDLLAAGHAVVALSRSERAGATVARRLDTPLAARLVVRVGDVLRPETLPAALAGIDAAGIDAVVHLAAIPRDWNGGRDLQAVNLGGTRNVLAAMKTAGVERLVHLGALGVTDRDDLHYAASKARAEREVAESGLAWTILKPSLLFGPGDGFFNLLAGLVRMSPGVVPVPGMGGARFQPLHAADLARCVRLALERPESAGSAIDLGGLRWWTYREIVAEVLRGMGTRRAIVPVPIPLIAAVARIAEALRLRGFPVASDQLRQLALDNVTALDSVRRAFGFEPRPMDGALGYLRERPGRQVPPSGAD
jgi:nucleoside-diphosphate-sugar epimerase